MEHIKIVLKEDKKFKEPIIDTNRIYIHYDKFLESRKGGKETLI